MPLCCQWQQNTKNQAGMQSFCFCRRDVIIIGWDQPNQLRWWLQVAESSLSNYIRTFHLWPGKGRKVENAVLEESGAKPEHWRVGGQRLVHHWPHQILRHIDHISLLRHMGHIRYIGHIRHQEWASLQRTLGEERDPQIKSSQCRQRSVALKKQDKTFIALIFLKKGTQIRDPRTI